MKKFKILEAPKNIKEYKKFKLFYISLILVSFLLLLTATILWGLSGLDWIKGTKSEITNYLLYGFGFVFFTFALISAIITGIVIPIIYLNNKSKYQQSEEFKNERNKYSEMKFNSSMNKKTIKMWFKLGYINKVKYQQLLAEKKKNH